MAVMPCITNGITTKAHSKYPHDGGKPRLISSA
jgi:hypothetical protein